MKRRVTIGASIDAGGGIYSMLQVAHVGHILVVTVTENDYSQTF